MKTLINFFRKLFGLEPLVENPSPTPNLPGGVSFSVPGFRPEWTERGLTLLPALLSKFDAGAKDMERFYPGYGKLNNQQKCQVWLTLFGAIASFESGLDKNTGFFKTHVVYKESNGADSIGIFQLSSGDSFTTSSTDLYDPFQNLEVALRIGAKFVSTDGLVAAGGYPSYGAPSPRGLARYWSVIRVPDTKSNHHLAEIIEKTKKAQV